MEDYEIIQEIGDGGFGTVYKGRKHNDIMVAIKKLKTKVYTWSDCLALREVQALKKLNHPNVISLIEVIREEQTCYLVFEYMEENLHNMISKREAPFDETTIKSILLQIVNGLYYIHARRLVHRDIKPENILCKDGFRTVKIADFGLSRACDGQPPFTNYVATRWYRAPELLLGANRYDFSIDIWAFGCLAGELYTLTPLFPGRGDMDQLLKISQVLGPPELETWPEGLSLVASLTFTFPSLVPLNLMDLIPSCSTAGLNFIRSTLKWIPCNRPTASQLVKNDYFMK